MLRNFLIKNYEKKNINSSKFVDLYLDAIISPSALNEDFFLEIDQLSPFGSGNNEPRFVIEGIKIISSNFISEKHIKTILIGKDGTTFNSIAFNAKNSSMEPFLTKKNKKFFNIAGKMKLNEWKGKRRIEFVIDDIAIN